MMAQRKNIPFLQVNAGDILNFGSGTTGVVISGATGKKYGIKSYNSRSLVFKLIHKDFTMLFTGDCGFEQENIIFASGADLKCDVLKMAHHGGAGSNSEKFIDAAAPTIALAPQPKWLGVDQRGDQDGKIAQKAQNPLLPQLGIRRYRAFLRRRIFWNQPSLILR
jgi:beta-lactamase superfamily II metal-dependent hydrolase